MAFKAPCDCNAVAGLKVYFPNDQGVATSQVFLFTDAHGNNLTGIGHLFAVGAIVKVILHVDEGKAYIQNADTNAYLEGKFEEKADLVDGKVPASQLPAMNYAPATHVDDSVKHITAEERSVWNGKAAASHNQTASTITAGTFAGAVVANASGQAPGTSLVRNSKLVSSDTNPTVNGEICWTYG